MLPELKHEGIQIVEDAPVETVPTAIEKPSKSLTKLGVTRKVHQSESAEKKARKAAKKSRKADRK